MSIQQSYINKASRKVFHHQAGSTMKLVEVATMAEIIIPNPRPVVTRAAAMTLGLKRYFIEKPCSRGHVSERLVSNRACLTCHNAASKQASYKEYRAAWRRTNKEKSASYSASYRLRNPGQSAAYMRAQRESRRDELLARAREIYAADPGKFRAKGKAYRQKRPDVIAAHARNRRAIMRYADGKHTASDIMNIGRLQKWRCTWCRKPCKGSYHVDHITPLAMGGSNRPNNLAISCPTCNLSKNASHPVEFARRLGMLL